VAQILRPFHILYNISGRFSKRKAINSLIFGGLVVILDKSEQNLRATSILCEKKLFAPAVHAAYYSSLQLIIHYVYTYCGLSEETVKSETRKEGSHNYFINNYVSEIKSLNRVNAYQFHQYFNRLKRKRVDSDYHQYVVTEKDSLEAKKSAERIKKFTDIIDRDGKCENIHIISTD
jgi:uncharacterized protein (UPF0332 family)